MNNFFGLVILTDCRSLNLVSRKNRERVGRKAWVLLDGILSMHLLLVTNFLMDLLRDKNPSEN